MDLPRFFLPPDQIGPDAVRLLDQDAQHAARVLRMAPGDRLYALDGAGALYLAEVTSIARHEVRARILERTAATGELPVPVTLVQGIPKGEKWEWIVQKATELGAARIQPVTTERTVVKLAGDRCEDKLRRWQAIAREAAEQCERAVVPTVGEPTSLRAYLARPRPEGLVRLACLERSEALPLARALESRPAAVEVVVGPEGGFAPSEAELLLASGALAVTLGARILRAETASLAALAITASRLEGGP